MGFEQMPLLKWFCLQFHRMREVAFFSFLSPFINFVLVREQSTRGQIQQEHRQQCGACPRDPKGSVQHGREMHH
jgi:hypothetical protein